VAIRDVRAGCAYVPQDNFLFSDTIANNIGFGVDDQTEETVSGVAKLADVHENIAEFSQGYQTVLGERGVTVSGGQKQRISIARALLKNAPILILTTRCPRWIPRRKRPFWRICGQLAQARPRF
jgi:ATP-binding cassette subfamily B protein